MEAKRSVSCLAAVNNQGTATVQSQSGSDHGQELAKHARPCGEHVCRKRIATFSQDADERTK